MIQLQGILPAVRNLRDFEKILSSNHEHVIFLETRLSQLASIVKYAKRYNKKVWLHVDLIQGLKTDEYGIEFLIRHLEVDGMISTKVNVISLAKKHHVTAVQRLFLLDSHALDHNLKMTGNVKPDYVEVLPGIIPRMIKEVSEKTGLPVIAGGLIRTSKDVEMALQAGASAVTTSHIDLWDC
ncbi:glycerol uptake operon antiterminator [Melghiribacillus thermohalophilus]|uniref:Glycerol uptake operon antiterminator regulatory protein n=1 Tax=Melghiribacillus thermohalophilus TaxID=1324956 RepID=A0A4R3NB16_9BACI|nr:glycerol-3-phosphate responsive antiterminator [Melghiribacillus thermohalophilus]TCT26479.1 glycerol uptake operon antiterminator [Melghiribacillus thermohalophilus]